MQIWQRLRKGGRNNSRYKRQRERGRRQSKLMQNPEQCANCYISFPRYSFTVLFSFAYHCPADTNLEFWNIYFGTIFPQNSPRSSTYRSCGPYCDILKTNFLKLSLLDNDISEYLIILQQTNARVKSSNVEDEMDVEEITDDPPISKNLSWNYSQHAIIAIKT